MFAFGFLGIVLGAYLIDCAVTGKAPVQTLIELIQNPGDVQGVLARNTGSIEPTLFYTGSEDDAEGSDSLTDSSFTSGGGAASSGGGTAAVSGDVGTVIAFEKAQLGKPYKWGGNGPNSWDCSGLTKAAYAKVGVNLGRTTYQQVLKGTAVNKKDLIAGDLVFPEPGHVQTYIGDGKILEAPHTGANVRIMPLGAVWKARRIIKAGSST